MVFFLNKILNFLLIATGNLLSMLEYLYKGQNNNRIGGEKLYLYVNERAKISSWGWMYATYRSLY
ncbi:hypothetical protein GGR02_002119 [Anoxybacillus voinovskiensis]|uniref:Uncharacterized protein n=1 Tax=Anoxybacteroides voinovskiense TaxID=230470 RepID=A0A840DRR2_9BACL|nr:hypothetical protein [Anoxybacillus voinovskiensis]